MNLIDRIRPLHSKTIFSDAEKLKVRVKTKIISRHGVGYIEFSCGKSSALVRVTSGRRAYPLYSMDSEHGFLPIAEAELRVRIADALGLSVNRRTNRKPTKASSYMKR